MAGVGHSGAPTTSTSLLSGGTALAALSCPGDKVVWVNTKSEVYHFQGERWFGKTKEGKYI